MAEVLRKTVEGGMELILPVLAAIGVLTILWGVLCAATRLVKMEFSRLQGKPYRRDALEIRQPLAITCCWAWNS